MAYQGWLIKVGNYTIPLSLIRADSYSVFMSITDLDSFVDANGVLHRNALEHTANKAEFETKAQLDNVEFATLMSNIRSQFTLTRERKASVTCYIPELDDYVTQDMYMPDIKPSMYLASDTEIKYNPVRLAFIGY